MLGIQTPNFFLQSMNETENLQFTGRKEIYPEGIFCDPKYADVTQ